jgi:hypothetical protein
VVAALQPDGTDWALRVYRSEWIAISHTDFRLLRRFRKDSLSGRDLGFEIPTVSRLQSNLLRVQLVRGKNLELILQDLSLPENFREEILTQYHNALGQLLKYLHREFDTRLTPTRAEYPWQQVTGLITLQTGRELGTFFIKPSNVVLDPVRKKLVLVDPL